MGLKCKQFNNVVAPIFEIKKGDFAKHTPFYKKVKVKWSLDINRDMMTRKNIEEINRIVGEGFNSLEFSLNPVEGHIDGDISLKEETLFKMGGRKKKRKKKKSSKSKSITTTSTSTSTEAPSGGSSGAY